MPATLARNSKGVAIKVIDHLHEIDSKLRIEATIASNDGLVARVATVDFHNDKVPSQFKNVQVGPFVPNTKPEFAAKGFGSCTLFFTYEAAAMVDKAYLTDTA